LLYGRKGRISYFFHCTRLLSFVELELKIR